MSNTHFPLSQFENRTLEYIYFAHHHVIVRIFFTISGLGWEVRSDNRLLAPRGHVTNAFLKQWVGILLMPKIDIAHTHISYPQNLTGNACKGDILWHKVVWFVLAAMLEGILLPSNMAAKTTFSLYLVKCFIVSLRCSVNVTTSSFQHFPWSWSVKFVFRKRYSQTSLIRTPKGQNQVSALQRCNS